MKSNIFRYFLVALQLQTTALYSASLYNTCISFIVSKVATSRQLPAAIARSLSTKSPAPNISDRLISLYRNKRNPNDFAQFINEYPDKDTLIKEVADNYGDIARSGVMSDFLPVLSRLCSENLETLRTLLTKQFISLTPSVRSGNRAAEQDTKELLRSNLLNWAELAQVCDVAESEIDYDITMLHPSNITGMLIHAPKNKRKRIVKQILHSCNAQYLANERARGEFNVLAQLIADVIVLFDLNIDVHSVTRNYEFRKAVLKNIEVLRASYAYCDAQQHRSTTTPLRNWITKELENEHCRVINRIQTDENIDLKDVLKQLAIRQALKKEQLNAIGPKEEHNNPAYFEEKLFRLRLNANIPIETPFYANYDAAMRTELTSGKSILILPQPRSNTINALAMNGILAHEMMHHYEDDNYFKGQIRNTFLEKNRTTQIDLSALERLHEKRADLLAGLHVSPETGKATAQYHYAHHLKYGERYADGPHLNGEMRESALTDLSRLQEDEKAGKPFEKPSETESDCAAWLAAKDGHPSRTTFLMGRNRRIIW